jgi:hypothetical protein
VRVVQDSNDLVTNREDDSTTAGTLMACNHCLECACRGSQDRYPSGWKGVLLRGSPYGRQGVSTIFVSLSTATDNSDDSNLSSRRRRTSRYRFLRKLQTLTLTLSNPFNQLTDPRGTVLSSQHKQPTGTYSFTAKDDGRHTYCFSNEMSSMSPKVLRSVS